MALETATYIDGLVPSNPTGSDAKAQGDDHIKLIKSTVKATFPNITAPITPTAAKINQTVTPAMVDISNPATPITWTCSTPNSTSKILLDSNKSFYLGSPAIGWHTLVITQGAIARLCFWDSVFRFPGRSGGFPPDVGAANEITVVSGFYDGVNFLVGYTPY